MVISSFSFQNEIEHYQNTQVTMKYFFESGRLNFNELWKKLVDTKTILEEAKTGWQEKVNRSIPTQVKWLKYSK